MKTRTFFQSTNKKNWQSPKVQERASLEAREYAYHQPSDIQLDEQSKRITYSFAQALTSLYVNKKPADANLCCSEQVKAVIDAFLLLNAYDQQQLFNYIKNHLSHSSEINEISSSSKR